MSVRSISAVTLAVSDMSRSVRFYGKLGLELVHGGEAASFTTFRAGESFVNLVETRGYQGRWWGRAIFRVAGADAEYRSQIEAGLSPDEPRDAPWGERYFHISDPDGHELSFAELLPRS
jgi:catechol 2,3-dioxygenase-like lactoylglutathione lyase family enzyme